MGTRAGGTAAKKRNATKQLIAEQAAARAIRVSVVGLA